jgi:hypothetical protein
LVYHFGHAPTNTRGIKLLDISRTERSRTYSFLLLHENSNLGARLVTAVFALLYEQDE